jgi:hypothetical protein
LGGYAWQVAHYLLGLRALGYDVWFYEDTGYDDTAYNPRTDEITRTYEYGVATVATFLRQIGLGERWVFVDVQRGVEYGPGAGRVRSLFRDAEVLLNLGGINRIVPERRGGRPTVYVDLDPAHTQLKLANGHELLRAVLCEHDLLFTFGENIGTARSPVPTGGFCWHPTRQPVVLEYWTNAGLPRGVYTTVGRWDARERTLHHGGEVFRWSKREEWLQCLDLPARSGVSFEMAMDVGKVEGDMDLLTAHGWRVVDPYRVSIDPWRYRDYLRSSRGEFTVAKEMNIRLRSGWFSDRAACYLAAGRPVVEQDTGFGDLLPLGPGLQAFRTVDEATVAVQTIEADYARASAHAGEIAHVYFAAETVLRAMLQTAGL